MFTLPSGTKKDFNTEYQQS